MRFREFEVTGAYVLEQDRFADDRGYFARTFCQHEFRERGLFQEIRQINTSFNTEKGTLRGMHYQRGEHAEAKVVRCTRGAIYDVIVDLREESPTRYKWAALELTEENGSQLLIPKGVAHGFQTLTPASEVLYLMSEFYAQDAASGCRYDDPRLAIDWPLPVSVISARDLGWPRLPV